MKTLEGEVAFWAGLQENREWSDGRLIFADWLDDRDDPRAAGMRALGQFGRSSTPGQAEVVGHAMTKYAGFCTFDFSIRYTKFCMAEFGPATTFRGIKIVASAVLPTMWLKATQALVQKDQDWQPGGPELPAVEDMKQMKGQWVAANTLRYIESQACLAYARFKSRSRDQLHAELAKLVPGVDWVRFAEAVPDDTCLERMPGPRH